MNASTGTLGLFCALAACLWLSCAAAAIAEPHLRGLNPRELSTRAVCPPQPPGYARCAAERLVYKASGDPVSLVPAAGAPTTADPAVTPAGYGPAALRSAYNLTALAEDQGTGKTIAVVDAYEDPDAESDLAAYRSYYGLAPCTTATGCFTKVEQSGTKPPPNKEDDWSPEISLDLDMASAICPNCHLLLEEATSPSLTALAKAAHTAATTPGVVAVSNSYAANEREVFPELIKYNERGTYESYYTQPHVAFTASAGDSGYEVNFPAVLSSVTAVGGTSLEEPGASNGGVWSETAWSKSCEKTKTGEKCQGTGGGCSEYVAKPAWQVALGSADADCAERTNNDVSADANPATGVAVYDTYDNNGGWKVYGGTSVASPIVAGFYALIGEEAGVGGASWDYEHRSFFNDVIGGFNQIGCSSYLCEAVFGYSGPTGVGTPNGDQVPTVLTEQATEPTSTAAVLPGSINPNGATATYFFRYGTTTAYGQTTTVQTVSSTTAVSAPIGGLTPGTTYHYQLVADQNGRYTSGSDESFTTLSAKGGEGGQTGNPTEEQSKSETGGSKEGGFESGGTKGGEGSGGGQTGGESKETGGTNNGSSGQTADNNNNSSSSSSSGATGASASTVTPGTSSPSPTGAASRAPQLSALTLTVSARTAVRRGGLTVSQLAFAFTLSRGATVRVGLAVRVGLGKDAHWRALPVSLTFAAVEGLNRRHLHGAGTLAPGVYRLTLTPAGGTARSLAVRVF